MQAIPAGRLGVGEEVAAVCSFLCSEGAGYVNGQVIGVNGGAVIYVAATTFGSHMSGTCMPLCYIRHELKGGPVRSSKASRQTTYAKEHFDA